MSQSFGAGSSKNYTPQPKLLLLLTVKISLYYLLCQLVGKRLEQPFSFGFMQLTNPFYKCGVYLYSSLFALSPLNEIQLQLEVTKLVTFNLSSEKISCCVKGLEVC